MKKWICTVLSLFLAALFVGCGGGKEQDFIQSKKFMKEEEILDIDNPTGSIAIRYTVGGREKTETFRFELYYREAPLTVTNFVNLAQAGHFDGLLFHRFAKITDNYILQGGAFVNVYDEDDASRRVDLAERSPLAYTIKGEFKSNGWTADSALTHKNGALAMARTNTKADSADSQFYISIGDNATLDGDYAVFGQIVDNSYLLTSELRGLAQDTESVGKDVTYRDVPKTDITIVSVSVDLEPGALGKTRGIRK